MTQLSPEHFEKISQLSEEMLNFPPNYFTEENILSWSKYFGIAPKDLHEYTSKTGKILRLAENMARQAQGLEPVIYSEEALSNRGLNPLFPVESFHFLWLQTLLILIPQTDGPLLDKEFSPHFKRACCLQNSIEILEDLKATADYYDNPARTCELHNATLVLMEELKAASTWGESEKIYRQIYLLNQNSMDHAEILKILKKASAGLKEQFLITAEIPLDPSSNGDEFSSQHQEEAGERIRAKLSKIAEKFSINDLSFFKNLDIKLDDLQKEAFVSQIKGFLTQISTTPDNTTGSTV